MSFFNFQCDEDDDCPLDNNIATFSVTVNPNDKSFLRGDTIWLETNFDTDLPLTNKNESIDINSSSCFYTIRVMKVGKNTVDIKSGFHEFEYINANGKVSQDSFSDGYNAPSNIYKGYIEFDCQDSVCSSKIGLKPKERGTYCINLWNGRFFRNFNENVECPPLDEFEKITFSVDDFHRELYQELNISVLQLPLNGGGSATINVEDNDSAYIFQVE